MPSNSGKHFYQVAYTNNLNQMTNGFTNFIKFKQLLQMISYYGLPPVYPHISGGQGGNFQCPNGEWG